MDNSVVIVAIIIVIAILFMGSYLFLNTSVACAPSQLQAVVVDVAEDESVRYRFAWKDDNAQAPSFEAKLLAGNGDLVEHATVHENAWSPSTSLAQGRTYTLAVSAYVRGMSLSSETALTFTSGKNAGALPEVYLISPVAGGYFFNKNNNLSDREKLLRAEMACRSLGGKVATMEQLTDAFNNGADWCAFGVVRDSSTESGINTAYPSYNPSGGCGVQSGGSPNLVGGGSSNQNGNILCYGVKPSRGTLTSVFSEGDARVNAAFSSNMGIWSQLDNWDGRSKYCCTKPDQTCMA